MSGSNWLVSSTSGVGKRNGPVSLEAMFSAPMRVVNRFRNVLYLGRGQGLAADEDRAISNVPGPARP